MFNDLLLSLACLLSLVQRFLLQVLMNCLPFANLSVLEMLIDDILNVET